MSPPSTCVWAPDEAPAAPDAAPAAPDEAPAAPDEADAAPDEFPAGEAPGVGGGGGGGTTEWPAGPTEAGPVPAGAGGEDASEGRWDSIEWESGDRDPLVTGTGSRRWPAGDPPVSEVTARWRPAANHVDGVWSGMPGGIYGEAAWRKRLAMTLTDPDRKGTPSEASAWTAVGRATVATPAPGLATALTIWADQTSDRCTLRIRGRLRADTVHLLSEHVDRLGCKWCDEVVVDLRAVSMLDATGAKSLAGLAHYVLGRGGRFSLVGADPRFASLLAEAETAIGA